MNTNLTNTNDKPAGGFQFQNINFNAGSPAYNIGGNALVWGLNSGSIFDNAAGVTETLTMPLSWSTASGRVVTVAAGATLVSDGGITGVGTVNLVKLSSGTLVLGGTNSFYIQLEAGNLSLDFTQPGSPTTNITNNLIQYFGGTLNIVGASSSNSQTFLSTTFRLGSSSSTTVTGGATLNLSAIALTSGGGQSTVFNGPATINPSGNVAATGTITTTTGGQNGGLLSPGNGNNVYATVGQYDWASTFTTAGVAGTSPNTIIGGSQVSGFYPASVNNTAPATNINWDISAPQIPTTIGASTNNAAVTTAGAHVVDSIRFNSPTAPYIALGAGALVQTGGVLITPGMGKVNTAVDGFQLSGGGINIVQNNMAAVFVTGTTPGSGGPFYSTATTGEFATKSGPGTWFIADRTIIAGFGNAAEGGTIGRGRYICKFPTGLHFWARNLHIDSSAGIAPDKWQMLTATFDGRILPLYRNGELATYQNITLENDEPIVQIAPPDPWDHIRRFHGDIGMMTIWNTSLRVETLKVLAQATPD